jgi:dolichol-phosphate mannosyltransferase
VYVRDNEQNVASFLHTLRGVLSEHFVRHEIICVNDASDDSSVTCIKREFEALVSAQNDSMSIINMSYYQGLEASMNAGVDLAIGDFVFEFDSCIADYDAALIMDVYERALGGCDIVAAAKQKSPITSSLFYALFNRYSRMQYKLKTESFRLLSRRAINRIHNLSTTIPYRKALYASCGLKSDTIIYPTPLHTKQKRHGESSGAHEKRERAHERRGTAVNSFILFTNVAYKIAIAMTAIMMASTLLGVVYTLIVAAFGKPVAGYTTTMLVITGGFFAVFAVLTIIIKYLSIIIELTFKKQKYTIESVEKLNTEGACSGIQKPVYY